MRRMLQLYCNLDAVIVLIMQYSLHLYTYNTFILPIILQIWYNKYMAKKTTKKNRVTVLFDDALKKELYAIAKNKQLSVSSLIRMWIAEKVESLKPKTRKK